MELNLMMARGAMHLLSEQSLNGDFKAFGIGEDEYRVLVQAGPWTAQDAPVVRRVLGVMILQYRQ